MKLFITGASGFVGTAATRHLRYEDHEIVAMARSDASEQHVRSLRAEPARCSLEDVTAQHLAGCEGVVHCAARVGAWGPAEEFRRSNVEGTERLLQAARDAGVRRFIHIGTEAALFNGQDLCDIDERYPYPDTPAPWPYCSSKMEAEKLVLAANADGFETVSVRPRFVWGPGDRTILPELLDMIERGSFAWLDGGRARTSTTHIDNLSHAIGLAVEKGRGGEAYFISDGEVWTYRDFLTRLILTQGVEVPQRELSAGKARFLAAAAETAWRVLRRPGAPPITRLAVAMMTHECTLRIDKAREELGYEPQLSVETGLSFIPRRAAD